MIGRFAQKGVYRELTQSKYFLRYSIAGILALSGYFWDRGRGGVSTVGTGLSVLSVFLTGAPIVISAVKGLLRRRVNVDELVALAIIACVINGEYLTAAVVGFVMMMGTLIEEAASNSARKAIRSLIEIAPDTATIIRDGEEKRVRIGEVKAGDMLLIKPGDRIPVDGVVAEGGTSVDESPMTGESVPVEKTAGGDVFAGTLNLNGVITVKVTRVGAETTLGKVIKLVSDAEAHKPPMVRLIDRYAMFFTPVILACAAAAWMLTGDVERAIAVLIVGCPCALILAAPTAMVAAISCAAKSGILVKSGKFLEEVARTSTIYFDKTGTITEGKPEVNAIIPAGGIGAGVVLAKAAGVEQNSTHPFARAILDAARRENVLPPEARDVVAEIGVGISGRISGRLVEVRRADSCDGRATLPETLAGRVESVKLTGATPLAVYEDGTPIGLIVVSDRIRASARETVHRLEDIGISRIGMLSGDHEQSAKHVAASAGISNVWHELKPQDKQDIINAAREQNGPVIYIGDGINDAPALVSANVGIAMGVAGADVALETADIALMNDDISKIPFLIKLSRKTLRIIKWNIVFSMVFNTIAVAASGGGALSPIMGALVHNIGSVFVVLLSLSIAFTKDDAKRAGAAKKPLSA